MYKYILRGIQVIYKTGIFVDIWHADALSSVYTRCENVIGRPCVLPWIISTTLYVVEDFKTCNSVTKVLYCLKY